MPPANLVDASQDTTAAVKVGCCGFPVARPRYFKAFALVEIQQTFYRPPTPETARRWREDAPGEFEFALKAWQLITHEASSPTYRRLKIPLSESDRKQAGSLRNSKVVRAAWEATLNVARILRADEVVFQCPGRFEPTGENKDHLRRFLGAIPREGISCIREPRGRWQPEEIAGLCREPHLVHCVDPYQAEPVTGGFRYFRLHGIDGSRHRYSDAGLGEVARRLGPGVEAYVLFNNVAMFEDARRLLALLTKPRSPDSVLLCGGNGCGIPVSEGSL